ncbi:MAG: hypothetical protein MJZ16_09485, partial [Bacteroidales bacterium]|nr:hypothetical protein [Bacteroidales bacterium]
MRSLYSGGNSGKGKTSPGNYPLLQAVPSDAALVMHFKSLDKALDMLNDSTMAFGGIADAGQKKFKTFISSLNENKKSIGSIKNQPAAIALLNSGGMIPLLILDGGKATADTTSDAESVVSIATENVSNHGYKSDNRNYILVSESETIIGSSIRHIENGLSILDADGMRETISNTSGDNVILLSGSYSGKIQTTYFASKYNQYSDVFKRLGLWTSLSIEDASEKHVSLKGHSWGKQDGSSFFSYARNSAASDVKVCDVLPSHTDAVISLPVGDIKQAIEAREKYLDAIGKIEQYKTKNKSYKSATEMIASDWAKTIGIKEVAIAWFHDDKTLEPLLLVRIS